MFHMSEKSAIQAATEIAKKRGFGVVVVRYGDRRAHADDDEHPGTEIVRSYPVDAMGVRISWEVAYRLRDEAERFELYIKWGDTGPYPGMSPLRPFQTAVKETLDRTVQAPSTPRGWDSVGEMDPRPGFESMTLGEAEPRYSKRVVADARLDVKRGFDDESHMLKNAEPDNTPPTEKD